MSKEIISSLEEHHPRPYYLPLKLNPAGYASDVLHPEYPAADPILSRYIHPYGKLFGIPQGIEDGLCRSRAISPPELLLCYFIPQRYLRDGTTWLGK